MEAGLDAERRADGDAVPAGRGDRAGGEGALRFVDGDADGGERAAGGIAGGGEDDLIPPRAEIAWDGERETEARVDGGVVEELAAGGAGIG